MRGPHHTSLLHTVFKWLEHVALSQCLLVWKLPEYCWIGQHTQPSVVFVKCNHHSSACVQLSLLSRWLTLVASCPLGSCVLWMAGISGRIGHRGDLHFCRVLCMPPVKVCSLGGNRVILSSWWSEEWPWTFLSLFLYLIRDEIYGDIH